MVFSCISKHRSLPTKQRSSCDSQQHVLLVLLEHSANVLKDVRGEEVDAAVDDVTHKRARLFHIMQDLKKDRKLNRP